MLESCYDDINRITESIISWIEYKIKHGQILRINVDEDIIMTVADEFLSDTDMQIFIENELQYDILAYCHII